MQLEHHQQNPGGKMQSLAGWFLKGPANSFWPSWIDPGQHPRLVAMKASVCFPFHVCTRRHAPKHGAHILFLLCLIWFYKQWLTCTTYSVDVYNIINSERQLVPVRIRVWSAYFDWNATCAGERIKHLLWLGLPSHTWCNYWVFAAEH